MWLLPDSPRWLISKSKVEDARRILQRARTVADVDPEVRDIQKSMEGQDVGGIQGLFQPSLKMPMIVGLGLAVFQQITGINTVIYYAPTIFKFAGISATGPAILAGAALTMVMWVFHVLAIFLLDRVGRRPLLLVGVAGQIVGLAILGAAFQFQQLASFKSSVAIGGLLIYVACFAFGLGPIFWLLISEIYPLKVRGAAMSAVTVTNWALNLVVALTFLTLVGVLGARGNVLAVWCHRDCRLGLLLPAGARDQGQDPRADRGALATRKAAARPVTVVTGPLRSARGYYPTAADRRSRWTTRVMMFIGRRLSLG